MKTFIIFALCITASVADPINHLALERMFQDLLELKTDSNPIFVDSDPDDAKMTRNAPIQIYINVNSGSQVWTGVSVGRSSAVDAEYEPISYMDAAPIDNKMTRNTPVRIFVNVNSGSQVWDSVAVGNAASVVADEEHESISDDPAIVNTENEPISVEPDVVDTAPLFTQIINNSQMQIYINVNADSQVWQSALHSLLSLNPNTSPFDPLSLLLKTNP